MTQHRGSTCGSRAGGNDDGQWCSPLGLRGLRASLMDRHRGWGAAAAEMTAGGSDGELSWGVLVCGVGKEWNRIKNRIKLDLKKGN